MVEVAVPQQVSADAAAALRVYAEQSLDHDPREDLYVITGTQSFFDRKEVRDCLAYLRWIDSPNDELALLRVINVPPRGMGASSVDKLLAQAVSTSTSIWKVMQDPAFVTTLPTAAQRGIENLKSLQLRFSRLFQSSPTEPIDFADPIHFTDPNGFTDPPPFEVQNPPGDASSADTPKAEPTQTENDEEGTSDMASGLMRLIDALKYREEIQRLYDDPEESAMRIGSLESVFNAIAQYEFSTPDPSLDGFLTSVTLTGREFGSSKDKNQGLNAVSLMTYHSAKGLEFPIVYMIGMEEGVLPHRRSISEELDSVDEERRLCYVGVTRAQDELTLTLPQSRFKWGKPRPTYPSRFLYELTDQADNPNRAKAIQAALEDVRRERKKR